METYYLQSTMNVNGIPEEMPTDLVEYLPMIPGDELDGPEEEASVYLDTLCNHFNEGDEVTLEALKALEPLAALRSLGALRPLKALEALPSSSSLV